MRAVVWVKKGPAAEALEVWTDFPPPTRGPKQLLIQAYATSVNCGEW